MYEVLGYAASFCIGLVMGLIGGGGSILSMPILVYLFSVEVVLATAYSLFIVGTTSLVGSIQRYKDHMVDFRMGLLFGIPALLAKFWVRRWGLPLIPETLIETDAFILTRRFFILSLFSVLILIAAFSMITRKPIFNGHLKVPKPYLMLLFGILIGFVTGIVGIGGGFLVVPTLFFVAKLPFRTAVGTTLLIISISSLTGFLGDVVQFEMNWFFLLKLTGIAILGILTGNFFSTIFTNLQLRKLFGWLILIMSLFILIRESVCI